MIAINNTSNNNMLFNNNKKHQIINKQGKHQQASKKKAMKKQVYLSIDTGDLTEIMIFLITCTIALLQKDKNLYHFIATLPVNYSAAYATSRFVMALEMTARSNKTFKLHRMAGILCLPYSLLCWYRIVVLEANITNNYWFEMFDTIAWCITAVCATLNITSGLFMLPHVRKRAPISVKQGFGVGTSFCISGLLISFLVHFYNKFRVQGNQFEMGIYFVFVLLACSFSAIPFAMAIYMLLTLEPVRNSKNFVRQQKVVTVANSPSSAKKSEFQKIKSFFYDVFVDPDSVRNNQTDHDETPKWLRIANVMLGLAAPVLPLVILCINYGLNNDLPGISSLNDNYSKRVSTLLTTTDTMSNLIVIPAVMFDLTLLLLKKKNAMRIGMETLAAIVCSAFLITAMFPSVILSSEEMQIQNDLSKALFYPLLG